MRDEIIKESQRIKNAKYSDYLCKLDDVLSELLEKQKKVEQGLKVVGAILEFAENANMILKSPILSVLDQMKSERVMIKYLIKKRLQELTTGE